MGDSPKIVGMAEMYNDVTAEAHPAFKVMYVFVDGAHHGTVGLPLILRPPAVVCLFFTCRHTERSWIAVAFAKDFRKRLSCKSYENPGAGGDVMGCAPQDSHLRNVQGIGAKLLQALLAGVPGGCRVVLRSAPIAVPFYERFGFQVR